MGSASLWQLASRGVPAVGFEQFEPGHDRGSSHGETRIIRTAYFEGAHYVGMAQRAFELWESLQRETGEDLLVRTGGLMIGPPGGEVVSGTLHSVEAHGLPHEVLDATALRRRYPQHRVDADEVAVKEEQAGFLRPERAVQAAASRARRLGADLRTGVRVDGVEEHKNGVRITAAGEVFDASHAIISVGSWLPAFLPELGERLTVTRQVVAWFPVADPAQFRPDRFPIYLHEAGGHQAYGFPTLDGETVKVAIHHEGTPASPDSVDREVHPDDLEPLQEFVASRLVGVNPEPASSQVCLYTNTPDGDFLVGQVGHHGRLILLGGFSGHGFKFSPVIGEIAADLVTSSSTKHDITPFAPQRLSSAV